MGNQIIEVNNGVEVSISIGAPIEDVADAVNDIYNELQLGGATTEQEKLDAVIQATKNWWFEKVVIAKQKQIEAAALNAAETLKTQLFEQLNNSPLRGA